MRRLKSLFLLTLIALVTFSAWGRDAEPTRERAAQLVKEGNYKEALAIYRKLCLDPKTEPKKVGNDLDMATSCLNHLGRFSELDRQREETIRIHNDNWRLLYAAAMNYNNHGYPHYGFRVAGEFHRGPKRGGGEMINAWERDRVRALQLMRRAEKLARSTPGSTDFEQSELGTFYLSFSQMLLSHRGQQQSWKLTGLTDLSKLPDLEPGYGYSYRGMQMAPVDAQGNPVFHAIPESFEKARTDGERWRWALLQATEIGSQHVTHSVQKMMANFSRQQFGVQTMAGYGFGGRSKNGKPDETGPFAVHTLTENETIAKLATGVKRFSLPDDYNFLSLYRGLKQHQALAQIFENRRQYPKAAAEWKLANNTKRVEQILGNWGTFLPRSTQPAGKGATVDYRFRNGKKVLFTAHSLDVGKILNDVKAYLKSNPDRLDTTQVYPERIGHAIVTRNQTQYRKDKVAEWSLELDPIEDHFDRQVTVTTPLQKAGAYLVVAKMADGNTSRIVLWIADTTILQKPVQGNRSWYFVCDAVTGSPLPGVRLDFFGYRQKWTRQGRKNKYQIFTMENVSATSDANGQVFIQLPSQFQWLTTLRTTGGRLAFHGFTRTWTGGQYEQSYNKVRVLTLTDRPIYRPGQPVKFKAWVRQAKYDMANTSAFAGRRFRFELRDAMNQKVHEKTLTADEYGGISGEWTLPAKAKLGLYRLSVHEGKPALGGGSFRVEEYKKPEFEVKVSAPQRPVQLGEQVQAKISALYYFGAPVSEATVKYKVLRHTHDARWFPTRPWDWFYGSGYGWYGYDYTWYPGWKSWGCRRPTPWWLRGRHTPPEVVAEGEAAIGADGTFAIPIDTSIAQAMHPDLDHRYEITAEVRDASRRTVVGTGKVLVARRPFQVFGWLERGHHRTGDPVRAHFQARTIDGRPVEGKGKLVLYRIRYDQKRQPVETAVRTWVLATNAEGRAQQQLVASEAGQYRLAYTVDDGAGHTIEGATVLAVSGEGTDGKQFRFESIEVVPEKTEYAPGETANLRIRTDQTGSTVLLFVRASHGAYLAPRTLRLAGQSTLFALPIEMRDMPNLFVEAVTIRDGRVHHTVRELAVPPVKRILNVKVLPDTQRYAPGQKAKVTVEVTELDGTPFLGTTVLSVYDRALEAIAGGGNVPEIKSFFWKWRRRHNTAYRSSLQRAGSILLRKGEKTLQTLGIFGHMLEDAIQDFERRSTGTPSGSRFGGGAPGAPGALRGVSRREVMLKGGGPRNELSTEFGEGAPADKSKNDRNRAQPPQPIGADTLVQPTIRKNFADSAYWNAALSTDDQGRATIEFPMPENLTSWKVKVWAMGHGTRVGQGSTEVTTAKDLLLRLQAPRFFVQKDEVVLSAVVHNELPTHQEVQVVLELDGPCLRSLTPTVTTVRIEAHEQTRVDWRVKVEQEGEAIIRMKALSTEESDAMEQRFPVYVHGADKMVAASTVVAPDQTTGTFTFQVPAERRPEASRLVVRFSPTLAGAMVDALPYLANYPYGCTEQTLNRFLPTVITQKVLQRMGVDLALVREKRTNLNAQELGDAKERAAQWKRWNRNPVFDEAKVQEMVDAGIQHLAAMRVSDGGWGWFSGWGERSWPHTTATVVHGLMLARDNDVAVPEGLISGGLAWLARYEKEQIRRIENAPSKTRPYKLHADNLDALVHRVLTSGGQGAAKMRKFLYRDRNHLSVYGKGLLGLALVQVDGYAQELAMVIRNIEQYLVTDAENQTAYLKLPNGSYWWSWYGHEIEAHACYLQLLSRTDPKGDKARGLVKYLLNNRKHATYWSSTRDTAYVLEAFAGFLAASGEDRPEMTVEVKVNGRSLKTVTITPATLFTFDGTLTLEGEAIETGEQRIELVKTGSGPLYANAYLSYFTLEDFIPAAGLEIKVTRRVFKLEKVDKKIKVSDARGQAVDQKVEKFRRILLENLATLKSGDLVEVELVIESKNDYEYLIFEDMKAAGFEPYRVRSGYHRRGGLSAYMELRDEKTAFFIRRLARGKHSLSYRLRAEIPGRFSALPTQGYAMYAPELRANSDEIKLQIED